MALMGGLGPSSGAAGASPGEPIDLSGPERVPAVGESFYQETLTAAAGPRIPGGVKVPVRAVLVLEPDNPYDSDAVAVHLHDYGIVGHLGREDARKYRQLIVECTLDAGAPVCDAIVLGGDSARDTHFCVWLHLKESNSEGP
jgi:hypothetical protein